MLASNQDLRKRLDEQAELKWPYPLDNCVHKIMRINFVRARWVREQMGIPISEELLKAVEEM